MEDLEKCPDMGEENNTLENPKIKREVFFLDDDHNIVDPGKSTQLVIGEYDENGIKLYGIPEREKQCANI